MALNSENLYNDIIGDNAIMGAIPTDAKSRIEEVFQRLSIHITEQIKRGAINDVVVSLDDGRQSNESNVK